jgi:hypothetical protein
LQKALEEWSRVRVNVRFRSRADADVAWCGVKNIHSRKHPVEKKAGIALKTCAGCI